MYVRYLREVKGDKNNWKGAEKARRTFKDKEGIPSLWRGQGSPCEDDSHRVEPRRTAATAANTAERRGGTPGGNREKGRDPQREHELRDKSAVRSSMV